MGDHEVECQPHFRMFLHTTTPAHLVPGELAAYVSLIYFHQTRNDIELELLDRFMQREKGRLDEERSTLLEVGIQSMFHLIKPRVKRLELNNIWIKAFPANSIYGNNIYTVKHVLKGHCAEGTPCDQGVLFRMVSYLSHVKEPVTKGHLTCGDTFTWILRCPLKTGFTGASFLL